MDPRPPSVKSKFIADLNLASVLIKLLLPFFSEVKFDEFVTKSPLETKHILISHVASGGTGASLSHQEQQGKTHMPPAQQHLSASRVFM